MKRFSSFTSYWIKFFASSRFISSFGPGSSTVAIPRQRRVSAPAIETKQHDIQQFHSGCALYRTVYHLGCALCRILHDCVVRIAKQEKY